MDWKQRREVANKLYKYNDNNLQYQIYDQQTDEKLTQQVIDFFNNGSELVYPAKYIFCNIVYSYFLAKYFELDFYTQLNDRCTLSDSPMYYVYDDNRLVYDKVLSVVLPNLEQYESISKTRKYFKQEFLIFDEDLSEVMC